MLVALAARRDNILENRTLVPSTWAPRSARQQHPLGPMRDAVVPQWSLAFTGNIRHEAISKRGMQQRRAAAAEAKAETKKQILARRKRRACCAGGRRTRGFSGHRRCCRQHRRAATICVQMLRQRACGIKQVGSATQRELHPHATDAIYADYSNAMEKISRFHHCVSITCHDVDV